MVVPGRAILEKAVDGARCLSERNHERQEKRVRNVRKILSRKEEGGMEEARSK